MTRRLADFALIFNTLIWGATFVVVKEALERVSPLLFLALRFSIATAALLLLFQRATSAWKTGSMLRGGVLGGCISFCRLRLPNDRAAIYQRAEFSLYHRARDRDVLFADGNRLSKRGLGFRSSPAWSWPLRVWD